MPLLDSISFLKGAVKRSLPGGAPSTYTFHEGRMFAQSPAILACYPMDHILGTFALAADDLEHALARMPTEPQISAGDGVLILKAGRLRSSITLLACEPPHDADGGINEWEPPPAGLFAALKAVQPFISQDGTWQRGAKLENGRVLVISNRSACEVTLDGLGAAGVLTDDCVAYLAKLDEPELSHAAAGALWFRWPAGAWVRCQLSALEWPTDDEGRSLFDKILGPPAEELPPCELTAEWRAAYDDIAALGDGTLDVRPGGLHGRTEHAEHDAEFATGAARETRWSLATLKPMFGSGATHWDPDAQGPARFAGPGVRGVVMGQRR